MKSENKLLDQCTLNIQLTTRIYRMKLILYGNFLFHDVILKFNRCQKQETEKKIIITHTHIKFTIYFDNKKGGKK